VSFCVLWRWEYSPEYDSALLCVAWAWESYPENKSNLSTYHHCVCIQPVETANIHDESRCTFGANSMSACRRSCCYPPLSNVREVSCPERRVVRDLDAYQLWYVMSRSPVDVHWHFGGTYCFLLQGSLTACFVLLARLSFRPWRWCQWVPPKRRGGLHDVQSQKVVICIVTAMRVLHACCFLLVASLTIRCWRSKNVVWYNNKTEY
jgi:hypothetical protein